jgi:SPP1 gp7 family putative phage head morphogenesis protein
MTETQLYKELEKILSSLGNRFNSLKRKDFNGLEDLIFSYFNEFNNADGLLKGPIENNLKEFTKGKVNHLYNEWKSVKDKTKEGFTAIFNKYNRTYLQTEVEVIKSRMNLSKQQQALFVDTEKSIVWKTSMDERVRDSHKAMEGFTRPVTDPVWKKGLPGSWGYNCRCYYEVVDKKKKVGKKMNSDETEDFGNPYIDGKIFSKNHNYFK